MIKPLDFICIGAGKSGTTSLFNYLRLHPNIYLPPEKEIPFFSDAGWRQQGWERFAQTFFSDATVDQRWGKITPQYMADVNVPQYIAQTMPNVKLIALLRNPVDRAFSYHRMMTRIGQEQRPFSQTVDELLQPKSLASAREAHDEHAIVPTSYIVRGEYGRILSSYATHFAHEQMLVLFTDDLDKHPQQVINQIMCFLDLSPTFFPNNLNTHYYQGGVRQKFPWLIPTIQRIAPIRWCWHRLSLRRRRELFWQYKTEINVVKKQQSISDDTRSQLVEFYRHDMKMLQQLIGQSVPWQEFEAVTKNGLALVKDLQNEWSI